MVKKRQTVQITSVFPTHRSKVFKLLQEFETLNQIAYPYITFKPIDNNEKLLWKEGETFVFKAKLLGIIPFGIHTIKVI